MTESNPFASFFESEEGDCNAKKSVERKLQEVNTLLSRVFLFTISELTEYPRSSGMPQYLLRLPGLTKETASCGGTGYLTLQNVPLCLQERIALPQLDHSDLVLCLSGPSFLSKGLLHSSEHAAEVSVLRYLAYCYSRAELDKKGGLSRKVAVDLLDKDEKLMIFRACQDHIVNTSVMVCTKHSETAEKSCQTVTAFVLALREALYPGSMMSVHFFKDMAVSMATDMDKLKAFFDQVLDDLYAQFSVATLRTANLDQHISLLQFFSSSPTLSSVLTNYKHWLPRNLLEGIGFETESILGKFLSITPITEFTNHFRVDRELFVTEVGQTTASLHHQLDHFTEQMHKVFDTLMRGPASRKALISWLTQCLESNRGRGKMSSLLNHGNLRDINARDGFFLNLCWIMLRLCSGFMTKESDDLRGSKVALIDVTYCCARDKEAAMSIDSGGCMVDFSQESKLASSSDEAMVVFPNAPFNFITHCFFLTHRCLKLGMMKVLQDYKDLNEHFSRGFFGQNRFLAALLLGIKAHALHPGLMELCLLFYSMTAHWMVQLVVGNDSTDIPDQVPVAVRLIPEFLVENLSNIVTALRQMDSELVLSPHQCSHYIALATVFMRSSGFVCNPHIRAMLVQFIHLIIYKSQNSNSSLATLDGEYTRQLLSSHQLACRHLLSSLLSIFIDIEYTGESMEFEDKFMYRLPMYEVLEFLWVLPSFRPSVELLSAEVVESKFERDTPLLLKFINMMINDAILQLDEGLQNLTTIKEVEELMASEEWKILPDDDKKKYDAKIKEAKIYASNRNQLSSKTVSALGIITGVSKKPFVIASMVDRMAAMLNYVLKKLVGKESRNLKVRNAKLYHFDPHTLVRDLIAVYINLMHENQFCEALPRDEQSFSLTLFADAERILSIVSTDQELMKKWKEFSEKVKMCYEQSCEDAAIFDDAPGEFLDPITNVMMDEPVMLPSSGTTMDRRSIIRHLLSTSQDPFDRSSLTPNMLQADLVLQARIQQWKDERKSKRH